MAIIRHHTKSSLRCLFSLRRKIVKLTFLHKNLFQIYVLGAVFDFCLNGSRFRASFCLFHFCVKIFRFKLIVLDFLFQRLLTLQCTIMCIVSCILFNNNFWHCHSNNIVNILQNIWRYYFYVWFILTCYFNLKHNQVYCTCDEANCITRW